MASDGPRFELDRLVTYDEDSVITEIRRVAALVDEPVLSLRAFDERSRVSSAACRRRFGSWQRALDAAGVGDRYSGQAVTAKSQGQHGRYLTGDDVVKELLRVAELTGRDTVTKRELREHSELISDVVVINRFGSWAEALRAAGLQLSRQGVRWTDEDYFENMLTVWTHHGRCPRYAEMNQLPSTITVEGYRHKFGTWGKAKVAFLERVNSDVADQQDSPSPPRRIAAATTSPVPEEERRTIRLGLRYEVLRRDRFRCVLCGRSPATDLSCVLHVDHIEPFARDGKTKIGNLRTLCGPCNMGKGDRT